MTNLTLELVRDDGTIMFRAELAWPLLPVSPSELFFSIDIVSQARRDPGDESPAFRHEQTR